jgi:hypothetical protein
MMGKLLPASPPGGACSEVELRSSMPDALDALAGAEAAGVGACAAAPPAKTAGIAMERMRSRTAWQRRSRIDL